VGADGMVYIGFGNGTLASITADGHLRWVSQTGSKTVFSSYILLKVSIFLGKTHFSAPAIGADGSIYVTSFEQHLYVFNSTDGALRWSFISAGRFYIIMLIFGTIQLLNAYCLMNTGTGRSYQMFSSPAIGSDGTIYFGSKDSYLYAIGLSFFGCPSGIKILYTATDIAVCTGLSRADFAGSSLQTADTDLGILFANTGNTKGLLSSTDTKFVAAELTEVYKDDGG